MHRESHPQRLTLNSIRAPFHSEVVAERTVCGSRLSRRGYTFACLSRVNVVEVHTFGQAMAEDFFATGDDNEHDDEHDKSHDYDD